MSAFRDRCKSLPVMSVVGGKADLPGTAPKSPLIANSGHPSIPMRASEQSAKLLILSDFRQGHFVAEERIQRRLAAIVAVDVVGYSRLMGQDEEGTLARLKTLRAELIDPSRQTHNGRIFKTTGDGIMIEFPSAVDAVDHAVNVQRGMAKRNAGMPQDRRIEFRIGINIGDVIVDEGDVFGDGVNVAARLEGLAEPGGICVSGAVYDQVTNKTSYAFDDMGAQNVKNIAKPVQVYRVVLDNLEGQTDIRKKSLAAVLSRPALAVLPFANLDGDPEQDYFADGLTEDIISALSAWRSFPVIARNSTFIYKGKAVKVQQVAEGQCQSKSA